LFEFSWSLSTINIHARSCRNPLQKRRCLWPYYDLELGSFGKVKVALSPPPSLATTIITSPNPFSSSCTSQSNSYHCTHPLTAIGNHPLHTQFKFQGFAFSSLGSFSLFFSHFSVVGCSEFSILDQQFRAFRFVLYCSNYPIWSSKAKILHYLPLLCFSLFSRFIECC